MTKPGLSPVPLNPHGCDAIYLALKVVNINLTPLTTQVCVEGMNSIRPHAPVVSLAGYGLNAANPPGNAEAVKPVTTNFEQAGQSFAYTFPGHSFTVIALHAGK